MELTQLLKKVINLDVIVWDFGDQKVIVNM